ncbi:MAG: cytochrome c peroxidase [Gemmatimonas sp.]
MKGTPPANTRRRGTGTLRTFLRWRRLNGTAFHLEPFYDATTHNRAFRILRITASSAIAVVCACVSATDSPASAGPISTVPAGIDAPPAVLVVNATQASVVGSVFSMDATAGGNAFSAPRAGGLAYTVSFSPSAYGLSATSGRITGTPSAPAVTTATITARDVKGGSASQSFAIVTFAGGLPLPVLPSALFAYADASSPFPVWFTQPTQVAPPVTSKDNAPASNTTRDAGATVGRVLFYDTRLSANDRVSCSSCHVQQFGFSDTARLSKGFNVGWTERHDMALANSRCYASGRYFRDERAAPLEAQVLQPIQDRVEMGGRHDYRRRRRRRALQESLAPQHCGARAIHARRSLPYAAEVVECYDNTTTVSSRPRISISDCAGPTARRDGSISRCSRKRRW